MAKTEDIEAKLAAYVDGEIDQAGRAEIEKHLASHAQHRQLIKELMAQRDLLRGLPREAAPLEVSESVNASLERAVLLGDVDGESDSGAMQIRPWSQFRAIAAILFFTASLAAVIYYLLPSPNHRPELASDIRQSAPSPEAGGLARERAAAPAGPIAFASNAGSTDLIAAAAATAPSAEASTITEQQRRSAVALRDFGIGGGTLVVTNSEPMFPSPVLSNNVGSNGRIDREMFQNMATNPTVEPTANPPIAPASQVVVVLASANPQQVSREVTAYLTRANIAWETPAEPMPAPLNITNIQRQSAVGSRLQPQSVQLKSLEPTTQIAPQAAQGSTAIAGGMPATVPSENSDLNRNGFAGSAGGNFIAAGNGFGGVPSAGRGGGGRGGRGPGAAGLTLQTPFPASTEQRIIARRLSRQQAAEIQRAVNEIASPSPLDGAAAGAAPTTSVAMSGFSSREEFVNRQTSAIARQVEKQLGTELSPELREQIALSPTTVPLQATTQPGQVASTEGAQSTTSPSEDLVSVPRFDPAAVNFSLTPTRTLSIDFLRAPSTTESSAAGTLSIGAEAPGSTASTQPASDLVDLIIVVQPAIAAAPTTAPAIP